MTESPVAIIGVGPVGLAAAHLLERGAKPIVFEAGESVGANALDWRHARMFSPWAFNVDAALRQRLVYGMPDALGSEGGRIAPGSLSISAIPPLSIKVSPSAVKYSIIA